MELAPLAHSVGLTRPAGYDSPAVPPTGTLARMSRRSGRRRAVANRGGVALASVLLGLSVAACSSDGSSEPAGGDAAPAAEAADAGSGVLEVSAPTIGDGELDLRQYEGKPLVLWFWAPG